MTVDPATQIVDALLGRQVVKTEFGVFFMRSYARYEGSNPRTGEPVVVPARHLVALAVAPSFKADVFAYDGESPTGEDPAKELQPSVRVQCGERYDQIVAQLKGIRVTVVDDEASAGWGSSVAWAKTEPEEAVEFGSLGDFAVFTGADEELGRVATRIVFRSGETFADLARQRWGD